jgi:hypothetical protein
LSKGQREEEERGEADTRKALRVEAACHICAAAVKPVEQDFHK